MVFWSKKSDILGWKHCILPNMERSWVFDLQARPDLVNFLLLGPAGQNLADLENIFNMNIINSACCA